MYTRKSVFVALTVVALVAMLVPVAFAAPEGWLHGIMITAPTADDYAIVSPNPVDLCKDDALACKDDCKDDCDNVCADAADPNFDIAFTIDIAYTPERDVDVYFFVMSKYPGYPDIDLVSEDSITIDLNDLVRGENKFTYSGLFDDGNNKTNDEVELRTDMLEGWYDVQVCAVEQGNSKWERTPEWCDVVENAVLVDNSDPKVWLDRPGETQDVHHDGKVWLTGQNYLLVGGAIDDLSGLDRVWFEYRVAGADWSFTGDSDWFQIPTDVDAVPSGVVNEFKAVWNTALLRDGKGAVRICATDKAGLTACSCPQWVVIENEKYIKLRPGWNLISTPLALYDNDTMDVLNHLKDAANNPLWDAIYAMANTSTGYEWTSINSAGVGNLTKIEPFKGYWIYMKGEGELRLEGTWLSEQTVPASYPVFEGWNLLGFLHWGQPTDSWFGQTVMDYLGPQIVGDMQSLWTLNEVSGYYEDLGSGSWMREGQGYWLALTDDGIIRP